jgi:carboxypeptidase C (cathepsin A)
MLAFCRSLTAVIALGLAVTASAAQERGSCDADRNNSHEDARQHASEHRERSGPGVLALLPGDSITEHSIDLLSGKLSYTATAGTFALFDQSGERSAEIFYTAFVVKSVNAAAARPVTFVFNGGPGTASAFLNLGMVGPRIAEFGLNGHDGSKVRLIDNPDTWLPFTDLVLIDPVGTGWSAPPNQTTTAAFGRSIATHSPWPR